MVAEQLKKSLLQSAFKGELTRQLPSDSDVNQLLKDIALEKQKLIKQKKIKKQKPLDPIKDDEIPFKISDNWKWIRLDDIGIYKKGPFGSSLTKSMFVEKNNNAIKVYEQKNAIKKNANIGDYYITKEYYENKLKSFSVKTGDILVSCAGTIGECYKLPNNIELGIINQALMKISLFKGINDNYFLFYFNFILKGNLSNKGKGSAIKNIPPFKILKKMMFPLPPIEEQQRIVDILEKVDNLERLEKELEKVNQENSVRMRTSLLQSAIKGELTEQLSSDSDVNQLLKDIALEKQELIKQKKIKKQKPLEPIKDHETPFDIPYSWIWVRLGNIIDYGKCNTVKSKNINSTDWVLDLADIEKDTSKLLRKTLFSAIKSKSNKHSFKKGDVLYSKLRPYLNKVIIADNSGYCTSEILPISPNKTIIAKYLLYYFKSSYFVDYATQCSYGVKMPRLGTNDGKKALLPLPPIEEQQRIVEKLDKLLPLCDTLLLD